MIKKLFLVSAGLLFILLPMKVFAQQEEQILSFDSAINLNKDSSIDVKETIKYYFPDARHGFYRYIPYYYHDDKTNQNFQTPIENIAVTDEKNQLYIFSTSKEGNSIKIKIGDPNQTITGEHTYIISYKVLGVINYFDDHDELYWNVTGNEWQVPIGKVTARIILPDGINYNSLQLACYTGATGSKEQNCQKSYETGRADFSAEEGPLTIVVGINKGILQVLPRQYEQPSAFSKIWDKIHYESIWFLLIPILVLIFLLIRYFRSGKDPQGRGTIAPEFEPPDGLLPGEMGTLIDEKTDRTDITATIIDLAVRGFLKIRERKAGIFGDKKYSLIKVKEADSNFQEYEKTIFKGIFAGKKEVDLEDIHETFAKKISDASEKLYQRLIERKYFLKNPDKTRRGSCLLGLGIALFSAFFLWIFSVLLAFSGFVSGILVMFFARSVPKKTREGVIIKEKSLGFKEFLFRAERYRVKWQEKENVFEKYLPYAMIFGIAGKWAKNFQDLYKKPPNWYEGDFTTFNTVVFASSLNSFGSTASSSYSPPSTSASSGGSGFGGGGSSGGGFGGGGGGSW